MKTIVAIIKNFNAWIVYMGKERELRTEVIDSLYEVKRTYEEVMDAYKKEIEFYRRYIGTCILKQ